jgi:hypothetical protein
MFQLGFYERFDFIGFVGPNAAAANLQPETVEGDATAEPVS